MGLKDRIKKLENKLGTRGWVGCGIVLFLPGTSKEEKERILAEKKAEIKAAGGWHGDGLAIIILDLDALPDPHDPDEEEEEGSQ